MGAVGEHIRAGEHTGIVLKAPQVEDGGEDVHIAAVFVHHDVFFQAAHPENQGGLVLVEFVQLEAGQTLVLAVGQAVGEVVAGQDDGGFLRHARLLQPGHQVLQRPVQLDVAGQVALGGVVQVQVLDQMVILFGHGVDINGVEHVAGEGHVVGVELVLAQVIVHGLLQHGQVGGGEVIGVGQARAGEFHGIAHVGVGQVPAVVAAVIIVVAVALDALLLLEDIA